MAKTSGRCEECGNEFAAAALQMHRRDQAHAHEKAKNFGYFEENVELLCTGCHENREAARREA
jgi:HNH endonuclease